MTEKLECKKIRILKNFKNFNNIKKEIIKWENYKFLGLSI